MEPKKLTAIPDGEFHIGARGGQYIWMFWSDMVDMESNEAYDTREEAILAWNAFCDTMTVARLKPLWVASNIQRNVKESRDEIKRDRRARDASNGSLLNQALHDMDRIIEDLDYLKSFMEEELSGGLR